MGLFSVTHLILIGIIVAVYLLSLYMQKRLINVQREVIKKQSDNLANKEKIILSLIKEKESLEQQLKESSDKLEMLEETLTRAGITADVWNTEDKVDDA